MNPAPTKLAQFVDLLIRQRAPVYHSIDRYIAMGKIRGDEFNKAVKDLIDLHKNGFVDGDAAMGKLKHLIASYDRWKKDTK